MQIREYESSDWPHLCVIHDEARKQELEASGLMDAFLTLEATAEGEGLFDGKVLVADDEGIPLGFIAIAEGEITWLYVSPRHQRRGVARRLVREAISCESGPVSLDVLEGNEAALQLYLSEGFEVVKRVSGRLAGNEAFAATGLVLRHHGVA